MFYLPPENKSTLPVVILAINYVSAIHRRTGNEDEIIVLHPSDPRVHMEDVLLALQPRLDRWPTERRVDRFLVIARYRDGGEVEMVYGNGLWKNMLGGSLVSKRDIITKRRPSRRNPQIRV